MVANPVIIFIVASTILLLSCCRAEVVAPTLENITTDGRLRDTPQCACTGIETLVLLLQKSMRVEQRLAKVEAALAAINMQNNIVLQGTQIQNSTVAVSTNETQIQTSSASVTKGESTEVYLDERFDSNPIDTTWFHPTIHSNNENPAQFKWSPGRKYRNAGFEGGLSTEKITNKLFAISTKFTPFSTKSSTFVLQFSTKFEQTSFTCGGAYIKVFDCSLDPDKLYSGTPHLLSFGLDACSAPHLKLNFLESNGKEYEIYRGSHGTLADGKTRVFTLVLPANDDTRFSILEDGNLVRTGQYKGIRPGFNGWDEVCGVGFEIYQLEGGTVFDNILLTSNTTLSKERQEEILRLTS